MIINNSYFGYNDVKYYAAALLAKGVPEDKIYKYGFAFEGKNVLIEQG